MLFLLSAAPPTVEAQPKVWRIGVLTAAVVDVGHPGIAAFRERLRELGYVEGQNLAIEVRSAGGKPDAVPALASELVRLKVDVIVATGRGTAEAAHQATKSIPIVMVIAPDPVGAGLVESLARPGGNVTGLTVQYAEVAGKRLQLLKDLVPNLTRVAVLVEPAPAVGRSRLFETDAAAALRLQLKPLEVRSLGEFDGAFASAARDRVGAVVLGGPVTFYHRTQVAKLAVKHRLPTITPSPQYAEAGFLFSYGPSYIHHNRRAAEFVDRILKGARPSELPVEQPTQFFFAINLKTAKAIGLNIAKPSLLVADQVIE